MMRLHHGLAACAAVLFGLAAVPVQAADAQPPNFTGYWRHGIGPKAYYQPPPEGGPGPIIHVGPPRPLQQTMWIGEDRSGILQPWAAEVLKKNNAQNASDHPMATLQRTCRPMGTPFVLTFPDAYQILQTPNLVLLVSSRNMQVRFVYMNQPHSAHPKPTYYGESVGHYEGDTLVVDTIGMNDKTWTDRFAIPHSDQLHVVERYRMVDGGQGLEVHLHFEDPKTFTTAWSAVQRFRRTQGPWEEEACGENNRAVPGQGGFRPPF